MDKLMLVQTLEQAEEILEHFFEVGVMEKKELKGEPIISAAVDFGDGTVGNWLLTGKDEIITEANDVVIDDPCDKDLQIYNEILGIDIVAKINEHYGE